MLDADADADLEILSPLGSSSNGRPGQRPTVPRQSPQRRRPMPLTEDTLFMVTCKPVTRQAFRLTTDSSSEVAWLDESTSAHVDPGRSRQSNPRRRGTHSSEHVMAKASRGWEAVDEVVVYIGVETSLTNVIHLGRRDGVCVDLSISKTSMWAVRGGHLAILLKADGSLNDSNYKSGTIVAVPVRQMFADNTKPVQLCDASGFQVAFLDRNHLVLLFCHNFRHLIRIFMPADGWLELAAQPLTPGDAISITALDRYAGETDSSLLLTSQDPLTPSSH
ncbi:hypothetical protein BST61_g4333 [Cercospora zeina]